MVTELSVSFLRNQWRKFAQCEGVNYKDFRICSDHFEVSCYKKKTPPRFLLHIGAVPTIQANIQETEEGTIGRSSNNAIFKPPNASELNQSSSQIFMTSPKNTNQISRITANETLSSFQNFPTSPAKPVNPNLSSNKSIINNQASSQIQLTPKTLRIKMKNRLLAAYRSQIQRLKRQKHKNFLKTKESDIQSIIIRS
ncbi:hypothetical protein ABEB36_014075 [Hypothenemus hampei]|uniref:THAP-type domain-containing protein n=1 Tax=Hypothenemus hampei TaxID=57062 RepID=A0ABD1E376_HYPHA